MIIPDMDPGELPMITGDSPPRTINQCKTYM